MLRSLYRWAMGMAAGPFALPVMALVAFIEAFFPFVPPDVMLAPMVLARRERAFAYAGVCTASSVAGGCMGYAVGYFASAFAVKLLTASGHADALASFQSLFDKYGLAVILIKGLTPVPYMVVTIASGVAHFSIPIFILASLCTRGGRFFLEATLLQHPQAKAVVDRHFPLLAVAGVALIIVALLAVRMMEHHAR
jgi:membrane protein YqaA with SNARE-associated domain